MIDFNQAVSKAMEVNKNINFYQEYKKMYIFTERDEEKAEWDDAPVMIKKDDGSITNYLKLSIENHAWWLNEVIAEGIIDNSFTQGKKPLSMHQIWYMFEHKLIPEMFFNEGIKFMKAIADEGNILNKLILEYMESEGISNQYGNNIIKVKPFSIKDILVAKIIFPEPEEEPLCYEAYAFYDTVHDKSAYYCLEKGNLGETPFLCGWGPEGIHVNYELCSLDRGEMMANMLRLFLDDGATSESEE